MVTKEDLLYRQVFNLKDGVRVLIRPLSKDDKQGLLDLFLPVPWEERRYMRHDISDGALITYWVENIDYDRIFPLVAVVNDRIVGEATIHFNSGPARHCAEIRIFMAKDVRNRGLGNKLIHGVIEIAKRRNIFILELQIVRDLINDIKALEKLGFKSVCVYEDYFMLPDGELRDIVHMLNRIRAPEGEF